MKKRQSKIISIILCGVLIFQQTGFAQVAAVELNIAGHFASLGNVLSPDKFRPLHLRSISYDGLNNNFKLLLDKGDTKNPKAQDIESTTKDLFNYFLVGIALPKDTFWVNLRPDSPNDIIDPLLAQTEVGKIFLEADLQLKKDTANATNPGTPDGKEYWDKLYQKAGEIYGTENVTIPTLTRPWIVPDEIIIRESVDSAYVYKATLKVMLEQDYLKDNATYSFKDPREKELNEYSSQIIREKILPKLTKDINNAKRYASLRQVYYSLILAQWFKTRNQNKNTKYSRLINRKDLTNLQAKTPYSVNTYFNAYKENFEKGEYNIKEPRSTIYGQTIRSYFSGGIVIAPAMPTTIGALPVTDSVTGTKIDLEPAQEVIPQADIGLVAQANDQGGIDLQETGQVKAGASDIDTMFADISEGEYVVIRIGEEEFRGLYGGKDDFGTNIELGSLGIDWWRSIPIPISKLIEARNSGTLKIRKLSEQDLNMRPATLDPNGLVGHGTNAFALISAIETNKQLMPPSDLKNPPLTGENYGSTPLNTNFVSTALLGAANSDLSYVWNYAEDGSSPNRFLTRGNIDNKIIEAEQHIAELEKEIEIAKSEGEELKRLQIQIGIDRAQSMQEMLKRAKNEFFASLSNEQYEEYLALSQIPVCIIGDGFLMGSVKSDKASEVVFRRVNIRVVGVDGQTNVDKLRKLLHTKGADDIIVVERHELDRLVEEYTDRAQQRHGEDTELIKMIEAKTIPATSPAEEGRGAVSKGIMVAESTSPADQLAPAGGYHKPLHADVHRVIEKGIQGYRDPDAVKNRYRDADGQIVIPVTGLLRGTGMLGHIGLGSYYGEPVIYIDATLNRDERQVVKAHEQHEIKMWEAKRRELGLDYAKMRDWIIQNSNKQGTGLAQQLAEQWHREAPSVDYIYGQDGINQQLQSGRAERALQGIQRVAEAQRERLQRELHDILGIDLKELVIPDIIITRESEHLVFTQAVHGKETIEILASVVELLNDDELAWVVAHEFIHAQVEYHTNTTDVGERSRNQRDVVVDLLKAHAEVLRIGGVSPTTDLKTALSMIKEIDPGALSELEGLSQQEEESADLIGILLTVMVGLDPVAAILGFKKIINNRDNLEGLLSKNMAPYEPHPENPQRVQKMTEYISQSNLQAPEDIYEENVVLAAGISSSNNQPEDKLSSLQASTDEARVDLPRRSAIQSIAARINDYNETEQLIRGIIKKLKAGEVLSEKEKARLRKLHDLLMARNSLAAMQKLVSQGDFIVVLNQSAIKSLNSLIGEVETDSFIHQRQRILIDLLIAKGLISSEEAGKLSLLFKQDKFVIKLEDVERLGGEAGLSKKLNEVVDELTNQLNRLLGDRGHTFIFNFGISAPVGENTDEARILADIQALQAAKMARLVNDEKEARQEDSPGTKDVVVVFDQAKFGVLVSEADSCRQELGDINEYEMQEVRGKTERELSLGRSQGTETEKAKKQRQFLLKRYLDIIDLFDYQKSWRADPVSRSKEKDAILDIIARLENIIQKTGPPSSEAESMVLEATLQEALAIIETNPKNHRITSGEAFLANATRLLEEEDGRLVAVDVIGFWARIQKHLAKAHQDYLDGTIKGETELAKGLRMVNLALEADDQVKREMANELVDLIRIFKEHVSIPNVNGVDIINHEGGDEIVVYLSTADESSWDSLAKALSNNQKLKVRFMASRVPPTKKRQVGQSEQVMLAGEITDVTHNEFGEAYVSAKQADKKVKKLEAQGFVSAVISQEIDERDGQAKWFVYYQGKKYLFDEFLKKFGKGESTPDTQVSDESGGQGGGQSSSKAEASPAAALYTRDSFTSWLAGRFDTLEQMYPGIVGTLANLPTDSTVLVIGPGYGLEILDIHKRYPGLKIRSIGKENFFNDREQLIRQIQESYPGVSPEEMNEMVSYLMKDMNDNFTLCDLNVQDIPGLQSDVIILGRAVVQYINDKPGLINKVHAALNIGGIGLVELRDMIITTDPKLDSTDLVREMEGVVDFFNRPAISRGELTAGFGSPMIENGRMKFAYLTIKKAKESKFDFPITLQSSPIDTPDRPGGIDFRFLPIVTQSMDNLRTSIRTIPQSSLQRIDLTQEWSDIERLVNSGIIPSAERLKEYMTASCFKGGLDRDMGKIVSCIANILREEEQSCNLTNPTFKDMLVVLGSGRSGQELKEAFSG